MRGFLFLLLPLAAAAQAVDYHSLVLSDYTHREPLEGWETTERVLARSLRVESPEGAEARRLHNPDRQAARRFFNALAGAGDQPRWIYLAAHQSRDGTWDTPGRESWNWLAWWPEPDRKEVPLTVVILDACHAAHPETLDRLKRRADWIVLACAADEETFELPLSAKRPVQFERRFPEVMRWLGRSIGKERAKISFFGFIWAWSLVEEEAGGSGQASALRLLDHLPGLAERFRRERSHRFASTIRVEPGRLREEGADAVR